jgi:hypothetical protein
VLISSAENVPITDISLSGNVMWLGDPATVHQVDTSLAGRGVVIEATDYSAPPVGPVTDVRVTDNTIRQAKGPGISAKASNITRCDIRANTVLDSGRATPSPGIEIDGFGGFLVNDNRSQDTRSAGNKTQSHGLAISNASGLNLVTNNDFSENAGPGISQIPFSPSTHISENLGDDLN